MTKLIRYITVAVVIVLLSLVATHAEEKRIPFTALEEPVGVRLETPNRIRVGQEATIRVILRNPYRDEQITLTAYATYLVGEAEVVSSASTTLTVDRSLVMRVDLNLGLLSLVAGSPTFDGVPISNVVRNNTNVLTFPQIELPADDNDHVLEIRVIR